MDLLKQILPTLLIKYNLKYETQIGRKNVIAVTYDEVRQSNLYKNLQGFGSTAYVARDDLRKLSLDVRKVVNINATIEDPETFDQNIFKTVLDFLTTDALLKYDDPAAFDLMFGSTYNKEDLKPEKITSEIQDVFGERDSQNQWHKQSSSQVSGSASIVGIASADVDVNSSLDESAMQHLFEKHGLKVEWTGEKWVPKSLAIKQVNVAAMSASGTFTSAITYLSNDESAYPDSLRLVDVLSSTPPGRVQARVHVDTDIDGILILDIQNDANWWMSRNGDMLGLPNQRFALAPDGQVVTEYFEVDTKHLQLQAIVPGGLPGQGDGTPTGSNLDAYVSVPDGPGHTLKVHAIVRTRSAAAQQIVLTSSVDRRTASIPAGTIPVVGSPGSVLVNNTQPAREVSVDLEVAVGATTN